MNDTLTRKPTLGLPGQTAPQFRANPTAQMKPATASQPPPKPPAPPVEAVPEPSPWRPMHEAPKDGSYVWLKPSDGGEPVEAYWYTTRQLRKGTWQITGWWRMRFGPASPLAFLPEGFRRVSEGLV